jgi:GxxExxY protein
MDKSLHDEELTKSVIGAFYEVYNTLRYGFTELTYAKSMEIELRARGHGVAREKSVQVFYKTELASTHRVDMIVDDRLVVEVKSTQSLPVTAVRQLYGYLRATELELGLLLHFGPEPKFYRQIVTNDQKPFNTDQKPASQ